MKVLQINATCGKGSTGKICQAVSEVLFANGIDNRIAYSLGSSDYKYAFKFSDDKMIKRYSIMEHINGKMGFTAKKSTQNLISYIEGYKPDIIHLHNIHSHDVDLELFFTYLKTTTVEIFWTFHDCWAFTGYCMYFDMVNCSAWKKQCRNCPQWRKYSMFFDKSKLLFSKKRELLFELPITIITPSKWLAGLTKESFLERKNITVINNGIDFNVFHPTKSNFREKNNLKNKIVILGVADIWDERKGLDVFIEMAKQLSGKYKIVLVGTDDDIDKQLPESIISIHRTANQKELAQIYTAADIFVNPTREDNYPTVNMESIACGTPVITFMTGGSPEMLNQDVGYVVEKNNIDNMIDIIKKLNIKTDRTVTSCLEHAMQFNKDIAYKKYLELYLNYLS